MESMKLELIIHSANGLNNVKHFGTMDPYAIIWIAGGTSNSTCRINTVKKGGSNPVWDASIEFNIDQDAFMHENHVLVCEIKHDGKLFDRNIGQVRVPLKHLLVKDACRKRVSYPVMTESGVEEGTITISYTLNNVSEGSKADVSSPADVEATYFPANGELRRSRTHQVAGSLMRATSVVAHSLSIAGSILDLCDDQD